MAHISQSVIAAPPVTLWPVVERRDQLPADLEAVVVAPTGHLETKEHVGGFWVLEATDLDEALA